MFLPTIAMADFIAGYISGAAGILIGSPLDIIKARLQTGTSSYTFGTPLATLQGAAPPLLACGALNAVLFSAYNRSLPYLSETPPGIFAAGAIAGLATFTISAPIEVVKCRAQLSAHHRSSASVAMELVRAHGIRGLYLGGAVTALRDSIGYGVYFAAYEAVKPVFEEPDGQLAILVAGGIAGVATWASIYPLDVVKTRVQAQVLEAGAAEASGLLAGWTGGAWHGGFGARKCVRMVWRNGGMKAFFDGIGVCMARAFLVNAVQWAIYEYIMRQLRATGSSPTTT